MNNWVCQQTCAHFLRELLCVAREFLCVDSGPLNRPPNPLSRELLCVAREFLCVDSGQKLYKNTAMQKADQPDYMHPRKVKERDLVVVVVGGRMVTNRVAVWSAMDRAHRHKPIATVVHGGTPGAEQLAGEWAARIGLRVEVCRGDWLRDEEIAVLQRNCRMLIEHHPDGVIIFPGAVLGDDMAARAGAARIAVWHPRVSHR